ncbi:MAG: LCP family protein [Clostridia bacterium]|nr:LCP family protein [Clostridia bacterium]
MLKRILSLMMVLCLLLGGAAVAEDEEYSLSDLIVSVEEEEPVEAAEEDADEADIYIDEDVAELVNSLELDMELDTENVIDPASLDLNPNLPDNVVNILLVGVDGRTDDIASGSKHGDVQIIMSINKTDGSIKMTSVLRDLYVNIPGYRNKNRINVAYSRGGGQLAMRTMNNLFEMNIEYYVTINFYGLASIIDSLGGIDIELTEQEAKAINAYINKNLKKGGYDNQGKDYERQPLERKAGVQHLDGIQAVMYARLRSVDNDFQRSNRQRHLLELLLGKVLDGGMSIDKLVGLIEACLPYAETNITPMAMVELAMGVLSSDIMTRLQNGDSLLEQQRIPLDETWKYYTTEGGASVVAFRNNNRRQENIEALHQFVYGAYYPAEAK